MKRWFLLPAIIILVLFAACAPKAVPAPSAPAPAAPAKAAVPASNLPAPTSQDAAWAKIVEAGQKEGQVNVYTWGWTGDVGLSIASAFEKSYGIKLNIITGRGAEFIERIKTEARMGNVVADVWEGASGHSENMKLAGLLDAIPDLPATRNKGDFTADPFAFSPEGYYFTENQFFLGLHVNTNLVKPGEEPKAWKDLLDPKWKGRILFADPVVSISSSYFAALIDKGLMTEEFLGKLGKQELQFDPSTPGVVNKLARGEGAVGYTSTNESSNVAKEGGPIKVIDTSDGIFANGLALGKVKGGPHPNASKVLINWILSQEGQDVYAKAKSVLTIRKDVKDYVFPAATLKPSNSIFIDTRYNDLVAKVFAEKRYVPLLKPR
ncbi:MAG: Ferric transporter ATP-binding subunit [Dehalococcoidia bacterium]|nr:Ferric transporter ATP-binding subunit [Dehalococcoidia bacterium]MBF8304067.1 Ferric transporter ATP-binding subunit [Dehalococcoidia bacterium]